MATAPRPLGDLPYGVGRVGVGFFVLVGVLLAVMGLGIFAYSRQLIDGLVVTGMRDVGTMGGAPWGLYISFDVYFVGVSFAGITIAALIRLMDLKHLRPIARMAEVLTVISLLAGGIAPILDLGQPLRGIINLLRYGRPSSPFFGTFTLVIAGYLFSSAVYLYLTSRRDAALMAKKKSPFQWLHRLWAAGYRDTPGEQKRHQQISFLLAIIILPLLATAAWSGAPRWAADGRSPVAAYSLSSCPKSSPGVASD